MDENRTAKLPGRVEADWRRLNLWEPQREALKVVHKYLRAGPQGSALVRMPTGTGKTGVIAAISQYFLRDGWVLIVAPWAQLVEQTVREVTAGFWEKINARPPHVRPGRAFTPSTLGGLPNESGGIAVCTMQTLERLEAAGADSYRAFTKRIGIVIVDEGHREPAPKWAKAVRQLRKPTVLFTATPYRNDQHLFSVDPAYIYRLPFEAALGQRYIRAVQFHAIEFVQTPRAFVDALVSFYRGPFQRLAPRTEKEARVIVRCATDVDVRQVADHLRRLGERAVAVHERFAGEDDSVHSARVPDPRTHDATFWVHQFKLLEGIDDPDFCLLAFYDPLRNGRALVQQVGRILRNPKRLRKQLAHVVSAARHHQEEVWDAYVRYEKNLGQSPLELTPARMWNDFVQLQEDYRHFYFDREYRAPFDPDAKDLVEHIAFRKAANIFAAPRELSLEALVEECCTELGHRDQGVLRASWLDGDTAVLVFSRCGGSKILLDQAFMEFSLGYTVIARRQGHLFISASNGVIPECVEERMERIPAEQLERLLPADETRISQLSLLNSDLAVYSMRRRALSARSIGEIAPGLADHMHFCSTAVGVVGEGGQAGARVVSRRYVGFTRARVAEASGRGVPLREFLRWLDATAVRLSENTRPTEVFQRFALHVRAPEDAEAVHILLDVDEVEVDYAIVDESDPTEPREVVFDDRCWDVSGGEFQCTLSGRSYAVKIAFDSERKKFNLLSKDLQAKLLPRESGDDRRRNLIAYLNHSQAFRVVTRDGLAYAHGRFYRSRVPLWGKRRSDRIDLLHVLSSKEELASIQEEKGTTVAAAGAGWARGSLFEYVDRRPDGLLGSERFRPDILICDDLGNELADFIAAQEDPPRVAMIHAKMAKRRSRLSASAFHEVCSQAVKNLGVLTPQWNRPPKNLRGWSRPWRCDGLVVRQRIRAAPRGATPSDLWDRLERVVRDPASQREVWILIGGGLSLRAFEDERRKDQPPPQAVQFFYLLQSTWSAVSAVGATLRVFCEP